MTPGVWTLLHTVNQPSSRGRNPVITGSLGVSCKSVFFLGGGSLMEVHRRASPLTALVFHTFAAAWEGLIRCCMLSVCVTANFLRPSAWCVVCALTLSRTALMHMETAGEGPTNQVLQTHKSVACANPLVHCYTSFVLLLFCAGCYLTSHFRLSFTGRTSKA